jgi:hypothetical protein
MGQAVRHTSAQLSREIADCGSQIGVGLAPVDHLRNLLSKLFFLVHKGSVVLGIRCDR